MLDIPRLLFDVAFRNEVIAHVEDKVIAKFWSDEFEQWNLNYAQTAVEPILNKIGAFTTNPIISSVIPRVALIFGRLWINAKS